MTISQRDINNNYARLINEGIQATYDKKCEEKGLPKVDLSQDTPKSPTKQLDKPQNT
jgi:hypothetical protein